MNNGWTALHSASTNGHTETVKKLLEKGGADVNAKDRIGWTALHGASYYGRTETVKKLLEKGADVNETSKYGDTALILASRKGHPDIINSLTAAIETEKKARDSKRKAMQLVENRNAKISSLRSKSNQQLTTDEISVVNQLEMAPPSKLGGKRKTKKATKKSKRKTRKTRKIRKTRKNKRK